MKFFAFKRVTRSGAQYNPFPVVPVFAPHGFELADLLKRAAALDADASCMDEFFSPPDSEPRPGPAENSDRRSPASAVTLSADFSVRATAQAVFSTSRKRAADILDDSEGGETVSEVTDADSGRGGPLVKRKRRRSMYRKKKNDQAFAKSGQAPRRADILKHVHLETKVDVPIELSELPATRCGYRAQNVKQPAAMHGLEDLKAQGYAVIQFESGYVVFSLFGVFNGTELQTGRSSKPLVDSKTGKIFGVIIHGIDDPTYMDTCKHAFDFLEECRSVEVFYKNECDHRRGQYPAVNYGVSYGQGSKRPYLLNCKHQELMRRILKNEYIIRLATFSSYLFSMWAPDVYQYYRQRLDDIYKYMPELPRNFTRSVWPCAAFNFGPQVCTQSHRDCLNCPFGWCAIQALGIFDHTRGGHLVLPDLKLAIEFPAGAIILIPSATLTHANTPVQPGERRISFTQFCAGGLFRFVDNGFRTEQDFEREDPEGYEKMMKEKEGRWNMGIGLWSTLEEILAEKSDQPGKPVAKGQHIVNDLV
ncbi:hypothetical protein EST38_g7287 [Candolleomyces aberdarensis]|uniref:Uncharacterized protein n=1 Tax=Candolleomyces aberdarensis TaxID=2316362 RepID=A0A4Q2DHQ7_9AGAR|nr:hypothetical protein EST38_g7287 [Candolleomyces aberdarensis]